MKMGKGFLLLLIIMVPTLLCLGGTDLLGPGGGYRSPRDELRLMDRTPWPAGAQVERQKMIYEVPFEEVGEGGTSSPPDSYEWGSQPVASHPYSLWEDPRRSPLLYETPRTGLNRSSLLIVFIIMASLFLTRHTTRDEGMVRNLSLLFAGGILLLPFAIILYLIDLKEVASLLGAVGASFLLFAVLEVILDMAKAALS